MLGVDPHETFQSLRNYCQWYEHMFETRKFTGIELDRATGIEIYIRSRRFSKYYTSGLLISDSNERIIIPVIHLISQIDSHFLYFKCMLYSLLCVGKSVSSGWVAYG